MISSLWSGPTPSEPCPTQRLTHAPRDIVIGAGCVAADPEAADDALAVVESKSAAERHHAAE